LDGQPVGLYHIHTPGVTKKHLATLFGVTGSRLKMWVLLGKACFNVHLVKWTPWCPVIQEIPCILSAADVMTESFPDLFNDAPSRSW